MKKCIVCNKPILTGPGNKIYCSHECMLARKRFKKSLVPTTTWTKNCLICNDQFEAHHPAMKYCSDACAVIAAKRREQQWRIDHQEHYAEYRHKWFKENYQPSDQTDPNRPVHIYRIFDRYNCTWYIGQTMLSVKKRMSMHKNKPKGYMPLLLEAEPTLRLRYDIITTVPRKVSYDTERQLIEKAWSVINIQYNDQQTVDRALSRLHRLIQDQQCMTKQI